MCWPFAARKEPTMKHFALFALMLCSVSAQADCVMKMSLFSNTLTLLIDKQTTVGNVVEKIKCSPTQNEHQFGCSESTGAFTVRFYGILDMTSADYRTARLHYTPNRINDPIQTKNIICTRAN
jgi:hypothetical protein